MISDAKQYGLCDNNDDDTNDGDSDDDDNEDDDIEDDFDDDDDNYVSLSLIPAYSGSPAMLCTTTLTLWSPGECYLRHKTNLTLTIAVQCSAVQCSAVQ